MSKMIFLNLPVRDLAASTRFYEAIGFTKNPQFSNEQSASMVWSQSIVFQLVTHEHFSTFTSKRIANARQTCGALIALSQDTRQAVDEVVKAAADAGGKADVRPPQDMGFMYVRTLEDPDGNVLEPAWMDPSAVA